MKARLYILLAIILVLTGCEGLDILSKLIDPSILPPQKTDPTNKKPNSSQNVSKSAPKNIPNNKKGYQLKESKDEKPTKEILSRLEPLESKRLVKPKDIKISIMGLSSSQLDERFGAPNLIRIDGNAELRVYLLRSSNCSLYTFLYSDSSTNGERVVKHHETGSSEENTIDQCYSLFSNARKPG